MSFVAVEYPAPTWRSLNVRDGVWQERARWVKEAKRAATYAWTQRLRHLPPGTFPMAGPVDVSITYVQPHRRRRDTDAVGGWFAKCAIDGAVKAGVLPGDDWTVVSSVCVQLVHEPDVLRELLRVTIYATDLGDV